MILFAAAIVLTGTRLSAGIFIAFLAGFGLFQAAFIGLCDQLLQLYAVQPLAERVQPVLAAASESRPGRADPGRVSGAIDVSNLLFGYDPGSAPLIDGLSFRIGAGETLIEAGVPVTHLYFVTDGALEVTTRAGARLAELGLGEVVGEMSFVEKRLPDTSVRAQAPTTLLAIPRDRMLAVFEQDNGLAMRFYRALAVFLSDRLRSMSAHDDGELDEGLLDNVQQAGERFIRLVSMSASSGTAA